MECEDALSRQEKVAVSKALTLVGITSAILAIMKLIAFVMSGSVVVLASMLDSLSDSVVSIANGLIHKASRRSADQEHPFGHGGIEVLTSLIQGAVLFGFGLLVLGESLQRLIFRRAAERFDRADLPMAFGVMLFAALSGYVIQRHLNKVRSLAEGQGERSLSLKADTAHYEGDAMMNLVTSIGLVIVWFSGVPYFDSIFGAIGSLFLFKSGWPILKHSVAEILHTGADPQHQSRIVEIILKTDPQILGIHRLRVRNLGPALFIDFHMMLPHTIRLEEAHEIGDNVTAGIRQEFPGADVIFHLDPDTEPVDDHLWIKRPSIT